MITKKQLIASFEHECAIIKHLFSKLSAEQLTFKPAPEMRDTMQLLRYVAACGVGPLKGAVTGNFELMNAHFAEAKNLTAEQFVAAMDRQATEIRETLADIPEGEFLTREVTFPWGAHDKLGMALVNGPLKFLTAYRMQLFLYAKLSGSKELNTANCWAGIDMPLPS